MIYSFQSPERHNFLTILKRKVYQLLWPVVFVIILQFVFPQSQMVKDHFHFYLFLATEVIQLFSITRDSVNEIIIDSSKKLLQVKYYNFLQGQMEEQYAFADLKVDISTSRKKEVKEIIFFTRKKYDITVNKDKDNFSQQDLESLKELLYSITSLKSSA